MFGYHNSVLRSVIDFFIDILWHLLYHTRYNKMLLYQLSIM